MRLMRAVNVTHKEAQRMVENIEPGQFYLYDSLSTPRIKMYVLIMSINRRALQLPGDTQHVSFVAHTSVEAYVTYVSEHRRGPSRNRIIEDYLISANAFLGDYLKRIA